MYNCDLSDHKAKLLLPSDNIFKCYTFKNTIYIYSEVIKKKKTFAHVILYFSTIHNVGQKHSK